ncbi:ferritin-like domain-containing protein [Paenibacillus sp. sptzw28]|uniref:ferritin-like domain-containing protein n=1 Tax=Paenibacillus sp. sptzw28 TaxID=715179 RepID=UPI002161E70A|nr:ferritin-like domain-containing protein [Paenibacillus sp. sptzw28]
MTTTTMTPPASQTQAQVPIPVPPRAITTKDLLYIKDALSWELLAFKKFHFFAQQIKNPQIKQALDKAGQMHQRHYQTLLTHLQVDNNAAMAGLPQQQQTKQQSQ